MDFNNIDSIYVIGQIVFESSVSVQSWHLDLNQAQYQLLVNSYLTNIESLLLIIQSCSTKFWDNILRVAPIPAREHLPDG